MADADAPLIDLTREERRSLRLCSYVELPFDAVVDQLGQAPVGDVFASSILAPLERDPGRLDLWADDVELVARGVARVRVSWKVPGTSDAARTATVSVLAVRTGRDPLTELLLDVPVAPSAAARGALAARAFLTALDGHLDQRVVA